MSVDDKTTTTEPPAPDQGDNVLPFRRGSDVHARPANDGSGIDDDDLLRHATIRINEWKAATNSPSLTQVQTLFHGLIYDGGSNMLRDKVVDAVLDAFGKELGGKRALTSTWSQIAKDVATERVQAARENRTNTNYSPLTAEEKAATRDALWPAVHKLVHRFQSSNHIRRLGRVYRTTCGRRDGG